MLNALIYALLGIAIFVVLAPLRRTRFYPWVRLLLAIGIPPYLLHRNYTLFPVTWLAGVITLAPGGDVDPLVTPLLPQIA